ncbi:YjgN family protein [Roseateles sp. LYH14W]|uniref:YjgN family protein n=1 Tax=Pelomonas parva TaxID=3299032 RepID=A0ABW7F022_9BURK
MTEPPPPVEPTPRTLEIRFTGSGSEYFRIWAVNLLLILLTCGLYLPFAKMRRIRYVYANTLIDGEPLAFHGDAWKMFRGFALLAVLLVTCTVAREFSPAVALPAFVMLCVVWPALWRAAMQFRVGNTSWRGLRMGFEGSLAGAYLAHLPVYIPMGLLMVLVPDGQGPGSDPGANGRFWFYVSVTVFCAMTPWSIALLKRYQHRGYRIAGERGEIVLPMYPVYVIALKTLALGLVMLLTVIVVVLPIADLLVRDAGFKGLGRYRGLIGVGVSCLLCVGGLPAYYASRLQDLVWGNTRSATLRFRSTVIGLPVLSLTNWVRTILTLGLYRPFAVMATMRLRLQSVRIYTTTEPSTWTATRAGLHTDAAGDVAGDFFGVDMGL